MSAHPQTADALKSTPGRSKSETADARPASDEMPVCCGQPMQPRFANAKDRYGNEFFVTVWSCAQCGKRVY